MKKNQLKIALTFLAAVLLYLPFYLVPDYAVMISASVVLIVAMLFVFYQVALVFFDKQETSIANLTPIGLPGEAKQKNEEAPVKKKKVTVNQSLPGVKPNNIPFADVAPEFEIDVAEAKAPKLFAEINEVDLMRNMLEIIEFWDGLSFYKIKDSEVYGNETVKTIGELYEHVFGGLGSYLHRYNLTLDDILNEDVVVKEYSEPLSSVVIGFIISIIEKEVAVGIHKVINKTEVIIPKIKTKNPNLSKVILSPEFKYQISLMIRKYYERQTGE